MCMLYNSYSIKYNNIVFILHVVINIFKQKYNYLKVVDKLKINKDF